MPTASAVWNDLSRPWRAAFDEAWSSWSAGCIGVGAVAVRGDDIVARGRNRVFEQRTLPGVLADSFTAHAEMNVLGQISWGERGLTLLTTLEPCLMCTSAIVMCRIDEVHHAGEDPLMTGIREHLRIDPYVAERWPRSIGPLSGPLAAMARLLPLTFMLHAFGEDSLSIQGADGADVRRARKVVSDADLATVAGNGGSTVEALDAVWKVLDS